MKKRSGKTYLKSLTKISDWALKNCIDDQLPKAIELKNRIRQCIYLVKRRIMINMSIPDLLVTIEEILTHFCPTTKRVLAFMLQIYVILPTQLK